MYNKLKQLRKYKTKNFCQQAVFLGISKQAKGSEKVKFVYTV